MPKSKQLLHKSLNPVRYAPFFLDWTFKKIFGSAEGKPLLVAMLNDFLARVLPDPIKSVEHVPTELLGATPKSKKVIFDILCEDSKGNTYLIEMQNAKLKNASDRLRLYITRIQSESVDSGNRNYRLPNSFFIGILNYKRNDGKFFFTEEAWVNLQTKEIASKKEFKVFVELPKFEKRASMCRSFRDKIVFLFKNLHNLESRPENFMEKIFDTVFSVAEISKLTGDDLKKYRYSMRYYDERQLAIDCAVEEATEAVAVQSYKKGVKFGVKTGIKTGIERNNLRNAKSMLMEGFDPAVISRITKLPEKQIIALR